MEKRLIFCYPWQHTLYEANHPELNSDAVAELKRIYAMISDMKYMNDKAASKNTVTPYYILYEDGHYPYGFHLKGWDSVTHSMLFYPFTNNHYYVTTFEELGYKWWKNKNSDYTLMTAKEVYAMSLDEFNHDYGGSIDNLLSVIQYEYENYDHTQPFHTQKDRVKRIVRMILPMAVLVHAFKNLEINTVHQHDYPEATMFENANKQLIEHFGRTFLLNGSYNEDEHTVSSFLKKVALITDGRLKKQIEDHTVVSDISDYIYPFKPLWEKYVHNLCVIVNNARKDSLTIPVLYNEISFKDMEYFMKTLFATDVVMFQREWYSIRFFSEMINKHDPNEQIGMALLYGSAHKFEKWQDDELQLIETESVNYMFPERRFTPPVPSTMSLNEYPLDFYTSLLGTYLTCKTVLNDKEEMLKFESKYKELNEEYERVFAEASKGYKKEPIQNNDTSLPMDFDLDNTYDELMEHLEDVAGSDDYVMEPDDVALLNSFDDI